MLNKKFVIRFSALLFGVLFTAYNVYAQVPAITSLSPASGIVGSSVTINGANFSSVASENAVYFGATRAAVTSASNTSLVVTVPAGATYAPIAITTNGHTAFSNFPFMVTFVGNHVLDDSSFAPKVDYNARDPYGIFIADIDGDGKSEMIVTNQYDSTVSIYRNISSSGSLTPGSFSLPVKFHVEDSPRSIVIADLDGDGKRDMAVADYNSSLISVFHNISTIGNISFEPEVTFATDSASGPFNVVAADVNGDGKPDLIVANDLENRISVFQNTSTVGSISTGSFAARINYQTDPNPFVQVADIDGDGKPDLVVAEWGGNDVSVLRNVGTAGADIDLSTFAVRTDFAVGSHPFSVSIADLDGDGKLDLVTPNEQGGSVSVLRNISTSGSIAFEANVDYVTGSGSRFAAVGDLNGDGKPDVAVCNILSNTISILKNQSSAGTITLGSKTDYATNVKPRNIAIGDLDGDNRPDVFVANEGTALSSDNTISVFRNVIDIYHIDAAACANGTIIPSGRLNVYYGDNQTFSITPAAGYHVDSVLVDGVFAGTSTSYTFTNVTANHTISAKFGINQYTITASSGDHGTLLPAGVSTLSFGSSQTYTITPDAHYHVDSLIVDGVFTGAPSSYTFTNINANHTISVTFAIDTNPITSSAGAHGSISPLGTIAVGYGGNQLFTITPNTGYHVDSVVVDNVSIGATSSYNFTNVTAAHSIFASFAIDTFTISAVAGANGTILPGGNSYVTYGGAQSFTIVPNTGYHVDSVLVDGVHVDSLSSYTFSNVTANHTLHGTFAINHFTITAAAGANGSITPSGNIDVAYGGNQSFTITAATGYHIFDVLVDGSSVGKVSSYNFTNVTANRNISALFAIDTLNIVSSSGANGSVSPLGPVSVLYGANQLFTISPNTGYHIDSVIVDDVMQGSPSNYQFSNVIVNHTIRATFRINQFTIKASAGSNGSITPPGLLTVNYGDSAAFAITPSTGYHVDSVWVDGVSAGSLTSYTFSNVTANHTISATFAINQYTIKASAGTNGVINPSGLVNVSHGSDQSFTITANTGYHVDSVWVDGVSVGPLTNYTFSNITANHTISATFAINQYTIKASAGTNGSISPVGLVNVNYGSNQSFTITANTGYHVDSVWVDGVSAGSLTSYTFTNVTANHTISAAFAINQFTIKSSAGTNGTITPFGIMNVNYGSNQSFTITPNAGYHIADVLVDGSSVGSVASYDFVNVTVNHTISASFAINQYSVKASAGSHGTISPAGLSTVNYGDSLVYTITPDTGYFISDVHVDTSSVGQAANYTFSNIQSNHTISATFAIRTLTVKSSAGLHGSISPNGLSVVNYGDSLTFTITPDSGYFISNLHVDTSSVGVVSSYTFHHIVDNHTIAASFAQMLNPAPVLSSITPSSAYRSETLNVGFAGTGFGAGVSSVNVDTGITVNSVIVQSSDSLTANITVHGNAVLGARNFSVTNAGPGGGTSANKVFTVLNHLPTAVQLIAPNNNDSLIVDVSLNAINFLWHRSLDADVQDTVKYSINLKGSGVDTTLAGLSDTSLSWKVVNLLTVGSRYKWTVRSTDGFVTVASPDTFSFVVTSLLAVKESPGRIPKAYALHQNYPNPFNPSTVIRFDLPHQSVVTLTVYNIIGQKVATLLDQSEMEAGYQQVKFDASNVSSGIYFYRISMSESNGNQFVSVKKMMLLK